MLTGFLLGVGVCYSAAAYYWALPFLYNLTMAVPFLYMVYCAIMFLGAPITMPLYFLVALAIHSYD
jgi:hypothetical protein